MNGFEFGRVVRNIIRSEETRRPTEATIHSIEDRRVNIKLGGFGSVIRSVAVIGDTSELSAGDKVPILWHGQRPIVLTGSSGDVLVEANTYVPGNTQALPNPPYQTQPPTSGSPVSFGAWQVSDNGVLFNGNTYLNPDGSISLGTSPNIVKLSGGDPLYRIWVGSVTGDRASFAVDKSGNLKSTAGYIAGWSIEENEISSDVGNAFINSDTPAIGLGEDVSYTEGDGFWVGKHGSVYRLRIGDDSRFVKWDGSSLLIQGDLQSANFMSGIQGWQINNDGNAEFNNVKIRGTLESAVIQYDHITHVGGALMLSKFAGTVYELVSTNDTAFSIKLNIPDGFTPSSVSDNWEVNDIIRYKGGLSNVWAKVVSTSYTSSYWQISVATQGTFGSPFYIGAGETIVNYGPSGGGVIEIEGETPMMRLFTHDGTPWTGSTLEHYMMLGDLDGYYEFTESTFGLGIGDPNDMYLVATSDGLKIVGVNTYGNFLTIDSDGVRIGFDDNLIPSASAYSGENGFSFENFDNDDYAGMWAYQQDGGAEDDINTLLLRSHSEDSDGRDAQLVLQAIGQYANGSVKTTMFAASTASYIEWELGYNVGGGILHFKWTDPGSPAVDTNRIESRNWSGSASQNLSFTGYNGGDMAIFGIAADQVYCTGDIYAVGDLSAADVIDRSDIRLKKDFDDLGYGIDDLMALTPLSFARKRTGIRELGFIAQEVIEIIPEAARYDLQQDQYSIRPFGIIAVLVKAVQELQEQINELKERYG